MEGVEFLGVDINFEIPADRSLYDIGSVRLELEGRNYVLDVVQTYTNESNDEITCDVEVDYETFPKGSEFNYQLTSEDLSSSDLKATIFLGGDYEESPTSMTLFYREGGCTIALDLEFE